MEADATVGTDAEGPTPTELALNLLNKVQASRERKSRFCMRFMPVETTCFASKEELAKTSAPLIKKHFPTGEGVKPVKVREPTAPWLTAQSSRFYFTPLSRVCRRGRSID